MTTEEEAERARKTLERRRQRKAQWVQEKRERKAGKEARIQARMEVEVQQA